MCAGTALPAAAQQTPVPPLAGVPAPGGQGGMALQAYLTQELDMVGFTDVQIMPESFLVRAKDKEGRPVIMVVNLSVCPGSRRAFAAVCDWIGADSAK